MSPEQATGASIDYPVGPVLVRLDPLRDGDGPAGVPARLGAADADGDHPGRAGADRGAESEGSGARCAGSSSGASPRSRGTATPRPRISRASWRRFATISPRRRARPRSFRKAPSRSAGGAGGFPRRSPRRLLLALGIVGWRLRQRDYFWKNPLAGARLHAADGLGRLRGGRGDLERRQVRRLPLRPRRSLRRLGDARSAATSSSISPRVSFRISTSIDPQPRLLRRRRSCLDPDRRPGPSEARATTSGSCRRWAATRARSCPDAVEIAWSPDRARIVYHTGRSRRSDLRRRP